MILQTLKNNLQSKIEENYNNLLNYYNDSSDNYSEFIDHVFDKSSVLGESLRDFINQIFPNCQIISHNLNYHPAFESFSNVLFFISQVKKGNLCFEIRNGKLYGSTMYDYLNIDNNNKNNISVTSISELLELAKKYSVILKKKYDEFNLSWTKDYEKKKKIQNELIDTPITFVKRQYLVEEIYEIPLKENETPEVFFNGFWPKEPKYSNKTHFDFKKISKNEFEYYRLISTTKIGRSSNDDQELLNLYNYRNNEIEKIDDKFHNLISFYGSRFDNKYKFSKFINSFLSKNKENEYYRDALHSCAYQIGWDTSNLNSFENFIINCFLDDTYWSLELRGTDIYGSIGDYNGSTQNFKTFQEKAKELAFRLKCCDQEDSLSPPCLPKENFKKKYFLITETKNNICRLNLNENENPLNFINQFNPFKSEIKKEKQIQEITEEKYFNLLSSR